MEFARTSLDEVITIDALISLHYFEVSKDFVFTGEQHNFWEFLYVDRGEVDVTADRRGYTLKQGEIIFHKPNEFHSIWANREIAPNLIVMSFECHSAAMKQLEDRIFQLEDEERNLLSSILKQGMLTFYPPFHNPNVHTLRKREDRPFGSEQLIKLHLERLLIQMIHKGLFRSMGEARLSSIAKERREDDLVKRISSFMREHLEDDFSLEKVYNHLNMSKTHVATLFKEKTGNSIVRTYKQLKLARAKQLIREGHYNLSEIADKLKYSSLHSFSRQFKAEIGMSPSEYGKSVKSRVDDPL